jgi:hypothetical protein|tara:strand:- start:10868 stop:11425 length:558 start_codon:yes stop_codon:yes gene_type:complete
MKYIFALSIFLFSLSYSSLSLANEELEWSVKFGGWSKHNSSKKFGHYDFNEKHNGIGVQVWKPLSQKPWSLGLEVFNMSDSFGQDANMVSAAGRYRWALGNEIVSSVDVIAGITYHDRAFLDNVYYRDGDKYVVVEQNIFRDTIITPSLMLTFTMFERLELDVTHIPSISENEYSVTFFRLGYAF